MSKEIVRFRVFRFNPDRGEDPRYDEFEVPREAGMTVLDGLVKIRELHDSSLAFRYACVHPNTCKMCVAVINGRTGYLCTTLATEETTVEPIRTRPVIKDLVVDLGWN